MYMIKPVNYNYSAITSNKARLLKAGDKIQILLHIFAPDSITLGKEYTIDSVNRWKQYEYCCRGLPCRNVCGLQGIAIRIIDDDNEEHLLCMSIIANVTTVIEAKEICMMSSTDFSLFIVKGNIIVGRKDL